MNKNLYNTVKRAIDEADDDYLDGLIECGDIPDRAGEILQHKLECNGQHVYWRAFWHEDCDSDIDIALADMIGFCLKNKKAITDFVVVKCEHQDFVFVVFLTDELIDD